MSSSYWFKVILSVTLVALQCTMYVGATETRLPSRKSSMMEVHADAQSKNGETEGALTAESVKDFLASSDGQIISEDTPVWTASRPNLSFGPKYVKLEKNKVQKTVDNWRSSGSKSISNRVKSSSGDTVRGIFSSVTDGIASLAHRIKGDTANSSHARVRLMKQSSQEPTKTHYLSILLVLNYDETWPTDAKEAEELINERILYAAALVSAVNMQLRSTGVVLRISAVVIATDRDALPYISNNYNTFDGMHMDEAFDDMLDYWREVPQQKIGDFPTSGYHVVVTTTDLTTKIPGLSRAKGSSAMTCDKFRTDIAGLIFSDNLAFSGVQAFVRGLGQISGAVIRDDNSKQANPGECLTREGDVMIRGIDSIGREWAPCSLEEISLHLKNHGECLQTPRQIQASGQPIAGFLPGDVMSPAAQCMAHKGRAKVCSGATSCEKLSCGGMLRKCSDVGPILDGAGINGIEMCVGGVAVY